MPAIVSSLLAALLILIPGAGRAATLAEAYIAARDAYTKKLTADGNVAGAEERVREAERLAKTDLEKQLHAIIGPVDIKGFAGPGKINLDSLTPGDIGFGLLDGLVYAPPDDRMHVIVTTQSLLRLWLVGHKDWWRNLENVPQDIDKALQADTFFTQAINTDAAFGTYAVLPIAKPTDAQFAFAALIARAQDIGPRTPDEIVVTLRRGARVFVLTAPANTKVAKMPACEALWTAAVAESQKVQDGEPVMQKGDAAFHRCFAARAPKEKSFAPLVKQAQALADLLATP